mmetsp:Transcript_15888/g.29854  ORF Transcript_15888/g.29854 Transcript_15888/m.29854 type:complete len:93 (+) Transcript_15888:72-350(+)
MHAAPPLLPSMTVGALRPAMDHRTKGEACSCTVEYENPKLMQWRDTFDYEEKRSRHVMCATDGMRLQSMSAVCWIGAMRESTSKRSGDCIND